LDTEEEMKKEIVPLEIALFETYRTVVGLFIETFASLPIE